MACSTSCAVPATRPVVHTPGQPGPLVGANACLGCWAAGYCAMYAPLSEQTPPACPLTPARPPRRARY